jgi:hypothetical protein
LEQNLKKEEIMKTAVKIMFVVIVGFTLMMSTGCAQQIKKTGFLSDYSRLEPKDDGMRYIDIKRLGDYSKFIIEPVTFHLHGKGDEPGMKTRIELANHMHNAIINAIKDRYMIVSQSAEGVARVRIAITDVKKSSPALNAIPQTKLTGVGLGGASMEGEVVDSETGEQIGAVIEGQKGKRLSMAGLSKWGDAKAVMDGWAKRFRKRLDEAHGR